MVSYYPLIIFDFRRPFRSNRLIFQGVLVMFNYDVEAIVRLVIASWNARRDPIQSCQPCQSRLLDIVSDWTCAPVEATEFRSEELLIVRVVVITSLVWVALCGLLYAHLRRAWSRIIVPGTRLVCTSSQTLPVSSPETSIDTTSVAPIAFRVDGPAGGVYATDLRGRRASSSIGVQREGGELRISPLRGGGRGHLA